MEAVTLTKGAVVKTVDGKKIDANNLVIPESHIISSKGKTLKGIGMRKPDPKNATGTVEIYDGSVLVVTIDKLKLATALSAIIVADGKDGVKKLYEINEVSVHIGYTQKGVLSVEGDYNNLIFYFS